MHRCGMCAEGDGRFLRCKRYEHGHRIPLAGCRSGGGTAAGYDGPLVTVREPRATACWAIAPSESSKGASSESSTSLLSA